MARKSKKISRKVTPLFDSMLVQNQAPEGEGLAIPPEPQPTPSTSQPNVSKPQTESLQTETPPIVSYELQTKAHIEKILPSPSTYQRKQRKTQKHRRAKKVTELPQTSVPLDLGPDKTVHKEGVAVWKGLSLLLLELETIGGALVQTRSERVLEKPNEPPLPEGHTYGSEEGSMEHTFELMDTIPPTPHDSPLTGGYTPGSDEGRLKLKELMAILKSQEIRKKEEVNHLTPKKEDIQADSDFDVLDDDIEDVEGETVHTATTGVSAVSAPVTTAGTLIKMKKEKAKEKGVAIKDIKDSPCPIRSITTLQPLLTIDPKDKGKGVLVEEEPEKPKKVKRRDQGLAQIESDAELAQRLHKEELAELDKAQKERQKQEEATSAALAEEFDEIQARIDADHELAIRLTHEEQEKYTIEERARLFVEFFERRKKQLAVERAEAIRNKPPTRTQVRNRMITYLKHMGKYTHQQLKHKNFEEVQKLYEREKKWIDDFKPIDDSSQQQAESTKKRPRAGFKEESSKKQKLGEDNDAEKEELRDSMDVVPRDDVVIDVESLATKYPIVDWKTHILNENMMLVNERYETTSPEGYDLLLWGDLKTLFEPNKKDEIWKNQQDYNLISWRLFDSCGVHVMLMNTGVAIHMMIEKKYPLTHKMLSRILNRRLEVDYESKKAFELLRFTRSQLQKWKSVWIHPSNDQDANTEET
ncbi:hypothetical protein Tco_0561336 [Tanacetum coccineum]